MSLKYFSSNTVYIKSTILSSPLYLYCTYFLYKINTGDSMVYLNLQHLLKKNKKSVYWLVKQLNSNYTVVNRMVNNEAISIRYETIDKLLELFNCDFNELFISK